jgi:hypothetical protein
LQGNFQRDADRNGQFYFAIVQFGQREIVNFPKYLDGAFPGETEVIVRWGAIVHCIILKWVHNGVFARVCLIKLVARCKVSSKWPCNLYHLLDPQLGVWEEVYRRPGV